MPKDIHARCIDWITKVLPRISRHLKQKDLQEARNIIKGQGATTTRRRPRVSTARSTRRVWCPTDSVYVYLDLELYQKVRDLTLDGHKIPAIKALRDEHGDTRVMGLKQAKETVEYTRNWVISS